MLGNGRNGDFPCKSDTSHLSFWKENRKKKWMSWERDSVWRSNDGFFSTTINKSIPIRMYGSGLFQASQWSIDWLIDRLNMLGVVGMGTFPAKVIPPIFHFEKKIVKKVNVMKKRFSLTEFEEVMMVFVQRQSINQSTLPMHRYGSGLFQASQWSIDWLIDWICWGWSEWGLSLQKWYLPSFILKRKL